MKKFDINALAKIVKTQQTAKFKLGIDKDKRSQEDSRNHETGGQIKKKESSYTEFLLN